MRYVLTFSLTLLLVGCVEADHVKTYAWAEKFCGDAKNIKEFASFSDFDTVTCTDGRWAYIPVK